MAGSYRLSVYYLLWLLWLERQRRKAINNNEGYGADLKNEPETPDNIHLPHPLIALSPLLVVGILNLLFTRWIPGWYGTSHELTLPGLVKPIVTEVSKITAIWAVEAALISGIVLVLILVFAISGDVWQKAAERR